MSWGKKWLDRYKGDTRKNVDKINWRHYYRVCGGKKQTHKWFFRQKKWFKEFEGFRMSFRRPKSREIWFWD